MVINNEEICSFDSVKFLLFGRFKKDIKHLFENLIDHAIVQCSFSANAMSSLRRSSHNFCKLKLIFRREGKIARLLFQLLNCSVD